MTVNALIKETREKNMLETIEAEQRLPNYGTRAIIQWIAETSVRFSKIIIKIICF